MGPIGSREKPVYVNSQGALTPIGEGTAIGSSTEPVFIASDGTITKCTMTTEEWTFEPVDAGVATITKKVFIK